MKNKPLTRAELNNPFMHIPMQDRLKESHTVDLRDNYTVEHLPNGYMIVKAIDESKTY